MERSAQRMPRLNLRKMGDVFEQLRLGFQSWADTRGLQILETYDSLPDELDCLNGFDDRFQDIAEPMIVLALLADAERPEGPAILPRLLPDSQPQLDAENRRAANGNCSPFWRSPR